MAGRLHIGNIDHPDWCRRAGLDWHATSHPVITSPNHAPRRPTTVIMLNGRGQCEPSSSFWGLTPSWLKQLDHAPHCARAEQLHERPMFRDALRQTRCIVPVTGVYVWQATQRGKQPFMVTHADRAPMLLAGIQTWHVLGEQRRLTFALITTAVKAPLDALTDRLPVVIAPENIRTWLDDDQPDDRITSMLQPAPASLLGAFPVSRAINALDCQEWHCSYPTGPMLTASGSSTD